MSKPIPKRGPGDSDWLYIGWFGQSHWKMHNVISFRGNTVLEMDLPRLLVFPAMDEDHGRRYLIHKDLIDG